MAQTNKQKVGEIGEDVACRFLEKHGYNIIDRNYRKKWGELDIVAKKDGFLHFVEVKSVSHVTLQNGAGQADYQPEENVHLWKQKRLARAIRTYLLEKNIEENMEWQIDVLAVFLDFTTRKAKFRFTENIIL